MASKTIATPMRSVISQLNRLAIAQDAAPKAVSNSFTRTITTTASPCASHSGATITRNVDTSIPLPTNPLQPIGIQSVLATIHAFPSLEPLRFEQYPTNHLYLPTRRDILHRAVVYEGDKTRLGTASTKWREEVHGSTKKVRPQKGTGRARLGDKKSPMLRGGGVAFGPKPRDFSTKLPRKVYDLAWRTALSYRFRKGELVIVDGELQVPYPSVSYVKGMLNAHGWGSAGGRSLMVTLGGRGGNLDWTLQSLGQHARMLTWEDVDVKDLLGMGRVVIEKNALHNILLSHQTDLTNSTAIEGLVSPPVEQMLDEQILDEEVLDEEILDEETLYEEDLGEQQQEQRY